MRDKRASIKTIRTITAAVASLLLAACTDLTLLDTQDPPSGPTPSFATGAEGELAQRYIVVLKDDFGGLSKGGQHIRSAITTLARQHTDSLRHVYQHGIKGFAAVLPPSVVEALRRNPAVRYIEKDRALQDASWPLTTRLGVGWGLGRIDQRSNTSDYVFNAYSNGTGVNIYVVDSGIKATHPDFGGRVNAGFTFDPAYPAGDDCNGHGTSVASAAAGNAFGVAPGATLWDVRTKACGDWVWMGDRIAGIDWVTGNRQMPAVMNLSIGLSNFWDTVLPGSLTEAALRAIQAGIVTVVSAGNDNQDACGQAPAALNAAIVVGATEASGNRASFSNYGPCLDLFAPGQWVDVADHGGGYTQKNGTSFAAPMAAGVAALVIQRNLGNYSTQLIEHVLRRSATQAVVGSAGLGSPNRLLYSTHTYVQLLGDYRIVTPGVYNWTARPFGGDGTYALRWELSWDGGNTFSIVGTGGSFAMQVYDGDPSFTLRVTLTTAGEQFAEEIPIEVCMGGGSQFCGTGV